MVIGAGAGVGVGLGLGLVARDAPAYRWPTADRAVAAYRDHVEHVRTDDDDDTLRAGCDATGERGSRITPYLALSLLGLRRRWHRRNE